MTRTYYFLNLTKEEISKNPVRVIIGFNLLDKIHQKYHFENVMYSMNWNTTDVIMATDYDNEIYFHNRIIVYKDNVEDEEILSVLKKYNNKRIEDINEYLHDTDELIKSIKLELDHKKYNLYNIEGSIRKNNEKHDHIYDY